MSSIDEHMKISVEYLKKNHYRIYNLHRDVLEEVVYELHLWFDDYCDEKGEGYDYTGINCAKHREQRHHIEGVNEAVELFFKNIKRLCQKMKKLLEAL